MRRFAIATLVLAVLAGGTLAQAAPPPQRSTQTKGCPAAQRCGLYSLTGQRFATRAGKITIPYRITTAQPWLLPEDAVAAIDAATRAWEAANPAIDFVFLGRSSDLPELGNDVNEIAWVTSLPPDVVATTNHRSKGSRRLESDTLLNVMKPYAWQGCDGASTACSDTIGSLRFLDVQSLVTQQLGHWLGLQALQQSEAEELTMHGQVAYGERRKSTLGLGDVRGVRAAYPCGRCRMSRVFTP